jgi:hypothetical protein
MPKASALAIAEVSLDEHAIRINAANAKAREGFVEWIRLVGGELSAAKEKLAGEHAGFQRWAREQFGWSKSRVYQLIDAADVVSRLSTSVDDRISLPSNEAQCRALVALPKRDRKKVWQEAFEVASQNGREPTAALIRQLASGGGNASATGTATADPDAWLHKAAELFSRFVEHSPERAAEACERMRSLIALCDRGDARPYVIDAEPAEAGELVEAVA